MLSQRAPHPVVAEVARRMDGKSMRQAAADLGIDRSVWRRIATGRQAPTDATLNRLCARYPELWALRAAVSQGKGAA